MPRHPGSATSASNALHSNTSKTTNHSEERQTSTSDNGSMEKMPGPMTRKRLSGLTGRTKAKTKKLLKLNGAQADEHSENKEEDPLEHVEHNPAFNSSRLIKKKRFRPAKTTHKTLGAIQSIGSAIVHPVQSAKSTATRTTASQLSKTERPFLSQKADIEYLQAHDNFKRVESISSSKQGMLDEEQESHRDKIREMEEHRENLHAAWTTSRHVVRVVAKRRIDFPDNEYFVERDEHGDFVRYEWLKWLGYVILHRPGCEAITLTSRGRILCIIRNNSARSTLTTLKSFHLTLIARDIMLNAWYWLAHLGNHGL